MSPLVCSSASLLRGFLSEWWCAKGRQIDSLYSCPDELHKEDFKGEASSSLNLSAILTLEIAPGGGVSQGSPPCCDIGVARFLNLSQLIWSSSSPHHVASAYLWIHPSLSSLCPTCGGVCWCSLVALDPKPLLESCSALCNHQQQQAGARLLGDPSLCELLADSRMLLDKNRAWSGPLGCELGGQHVQKTPQNAALNLSFPKVSMKR